MLLCMLLLGKCLRFVYARGCISRKILLFQLCHYFCCCCMQRLISKYLHSVMEFQPIFLILWKAERLILCRNEYSNSLTRPELLPVAVFYGKTQLENVQTPPDRRPGGPQRWRRRRPYTACTTMWGESITPFAQRVVHAQHANCCLLACLLGRQGKITRLHTQKSLLKTAPQEMSVCIWTHLGLEFRLWHWRLFAMDQKISWVLIYICSIFFASFA